MGVVALSTSTPLGEGKEKGKELRPGLRLRLRGGEYILGLRLGNYRGELKACCGRSSE